MRLPTANLTSPSVHEAAENGKGLNSRDKLKQRTRYFKIQPSLHSDSNLFRQTNIFIELCVQISIYSKSHTFRYSLIHTSIHPYIHTFIHPYIHTFIHPYIHTSIHPYIHTSIHPYIHTFVHPYIHTFIHPYIHTQIHTHIHTYTQHTPMKIHVHRAPLKTKRKERNRKKNRKEIHQTTT